MFVQAWHDTPPYTHLQAHAELGCKHVLQLAVDQVQHEIFVWQLLHALLGKEDQAAHETFELSQVRGEERQKVLVHIVNRFRLLGGRGHEEAEVLGAVEVEFEGRRMGV